MCIVRKYGPMKSRKESRFAVVMSRKLEQHYQFWMFCFGVSSDISLRGDSDVYIAYPHLLPFNELRDLLQSESRQYNILRYTLISRYSMFLI